MSTEHETGGQEHHRDTEKESTGRLRPFPGSRKVYIQGSRPDLLVPEREIALHDTSTPQGVEHNEALRVYDTSGPMTDPDYEVDIRTGLPALRRMWITEREDVESYKGRAIKPEDNGLKPGSKRAGAETYPGVTGEPLRAREGRCVTQMHYARRGIITPEMEFAAIREGVEPEFVR